jgi:hypothetical protein
MTTRPQRGGRCGERLVICVSDRVAGGAVECLRMETVRLRAIQQPSRIERLLVAFALRSGIVNPDGHMLRDQRAVPAVLQSVIFQAMRRDRAWCAWRYNSRIWLLTCEMLLERSREHGSPVLDVQLYDESGELKDSAWWLVDREGEWRRGACEDGPATGPTAAPVSSA